ncbi:MAG: trypsin-like peptidase domain-containing protein [Chloroflexi bacterium]|nr:trypsin-like peptidase domain-containing protein [Chloroflexota bacterium]
MRRQNLFRYCALVLAFTLMLLSVPACQEEAGAPGSSAQNTSTGARPQPTAPPRPATPLTSDFSAAVRLVAQRVKPAVVQITNEQVQVDLFNRAFRVPAGVGSGVIYDSRGYVLTNNHVVEGAQRLLVSLPDGQSFEGKLLGRDPQTDLAVVRIDSANLPVAELGDSDQLQVGDWVVAIGNALGLTGGPTVTAGVVGALGRTIQEPGGISGTGGPFLFDVIQTDAAINPGNSGGPLVNLAGQVVGINTLVAGDSGSGVQAEGIGFAIAVNTAKPIADQLVSTGKAVHPYLGIQYQFLTPAVASRLGVRQAQGVWVGAVTPNSPAASAGLRRNDIITEMDGTALKDDSQLSRIIDGRKPGDTITLTLVRDGQPVKVQAKLGQLPAS